MRTILDAAAGVKALGKLKAKEMGLRLRALLRPGGPYAGLCQLRVPVPLPLDPSVLVTGVNPETAAIFSSATYPTLIEFWTLPPAAAAAATAAATAAAAAAAAVPAAPAAPATAAAAAALAASGVAAAASATASAVAAAVQGAAAALSPAAAAAAGGAPPTASVTPADALSAVGSFFGPRPSVKVSARPPGPPTRPQHPD